MSVMVEARGRENGAAPRRARRTVDFNGRAQSDPNGATRTVAPVMNRQSHPHSIYRTPPTMPSIAADFWVRRLRREDVDAYRALMLQAYADHPDAFTSSVSERAALPLDWWRQRVGAQVDAHEVVFGVFANGTLVGAVGLARETREKTRHKATLFGMMVYPQYQGHGMGRALVQAVLDYAARLPGLRMVQLTVTEGNTRAQALYQRMGFVAYGVEPMAVAVGAGFANKIHMACRLQTVSVPGDSGCGG